MHDPGDYTGKPLAPGVVFALDPQMWVPEERLYIRVEDTIVVTETSVEVLTRGAPLESGGNGERCRTNLEKDIRRFG